jgi:hypothetical protein
MVTISNIQAVKAAFSAITSPSGGSGTLDQKLFALVSQNSIQKVELKSFVCTGLPVSRIETRTWNDNMPYQIASEKMQCTGAATIKIGTEEYTCKLHIKVALQLSTGETQCKFQVSPNDARVQWVSVSCVSPLPDSELLKQLENLSTTKLETSN